MNGRDGALCAGKGDLTWRQHPGEGQPIGHGLQEMPPRHIGRLGVSSPDPLAQRAFSAPALKGAMLCDV